MMAQGLGITLGWAQPEVTDAAIRGGRGWWSMEETNVMFLVN